MNKNTRALMENKGFAPLIAMFVFAVLSFLIGFFLLKGTDGEKMLVILAIAEAAASILFTVLFLMKRKKKKAELEELINSIRNDSEDAKSKTLINFPMPIAVFRMEDTQIVWANDAFYRASGETFRRMDATITDAVPGFSGKWLSEGEKQYPDLIPLLDRRYRVHGTVIHSDGDDPAAQMGITYWIDITDYDDIRIEYEKSRPVVGVFVIDNFEELTKNQAEREKNRIRDNIEDKLQEWAGKYEGFARRYERDRYIGVFEKRHLAQMIEEKFSILEDMHSINSPSGFSASMSFGFGEDAEDFTEAVSFADKAVDLALTRGGDQVVVKNQLSFDFYGGRGGEVEKRTKVKSRVMANTLVELIRDSSKVYAMGHRYGDLDSIGAAVGVCSLARQNNIRYNIIADTNNTAALPLIDRMRKEPEYRSAFISVQEALQHADGRTLLVVVDTNRPEQVEDASLLDACNRVAVIDHHRVAATYIHNAALGFIEPYASSTCELLTEALQEVTDNSNLLKCEAEALLSGIVLDTKNFTLRTGERTFDAGAYLRRAGADTVDVKKLLQSNLEDTIAKYKVLQNAEIYRDIAIAVVPEVTNRIVAAKAADEMLNISGVEASIVLAASAEGGCFASARSIGELNMQILMEKLGGGGNRSAAAAQMRNTELEDAKSQLLKAIDDYLG